MRIFLTWFVLSVTTTLAIGDEPSFDAPWRAFDVADFPEFAPIQVIGCDLDNDGDVDALVAREFWWSPGLAVLRNNGDGTFADPELYHLNNQMDVGGIAVADMDLDGDLDAVTTIAGNSGTDFRVALWRNNGDGTFANPTLFETGDGPTGVVIADVTGDGFPDVVTADNGYVAGMNDTISILEHNGQTEGQAGFLPYRTITVGDNCQRVVAADVDGDGDIDLAVGRGALAGGASGIHVLSNDGTGQFDEIFSGEAVPGSYRNSFAVGLADMDNDGDVDLIAGGATNGNPSVGKVAIRRNNGTGVFGQPEVYDLAAYSFTPYSIQARDLNGDGWLDVFATTPSGRTIDGFNALLNDGTGNFDSAQYYHSAKWTYDADAWDVDSDGDLDVVTVANDSSVITVHENPGDGRFPRLSQFLLSGLTEGTAAGDYNGDRLSDIAVWKGTNVKVFRADTNDGPSSSFQFIQEFEFNRNARPEAVRIRDVTGDGWADLIIADSSILEIRFSNGNGTFQEPLAISTGHCGVAGLGIDDLDNDGDPDIVLADRFNCAGGIRYTIVRNEGGQSFVFQGIVNSPQPVQGLRLGDTNNDGNLDIVSLLSSSGIGVFLGNGNLTFQPSPIVTGEFPAYWDLGDANGDGVLDLLMVMPQDSFGTVPFALSLGYGDGAFQFRTEYPGSTGREGAFRITNQADAADVNGDGLCDLITTNNASNDISVMYGQADGTLAGHDRYGAGYSPLRTSVADFTGDGRIDIATIIALPPFGLLDALVMIPGIAPSSPPGDTLLIDFSVVTGTVLGGQTGDLIASDDAHLRLRSGFGNTFIDLHHMELIVGAVTSVPSPAEIDITIEDRIDQPSGLAQVRLRNWTTGRFDTVGSYPLNSNDTIHDITGIAAGNYVNGSGEIDVAIKHIVFVPFLAFTFESFIDQVEITVR